MAFAGVDSDGQTDYSGPAELWKEENTHQAWYDKAVAYWDRQEASDNGVLGGYGHVSRADVLESRAFLMKVFGKQLRQAETEGVCLVAVDCGAGVGRVSEQLLLHVFQEVDLIEPSAHLLCTATERLTGPGRKPFPAAHRAVNFFQLGLQQFTPAPLRYDVIWIQWALLYLTDDDALAFFERCRAGLRPGGIIVVKENICRQGFIHDKEDSSLTRSNSYMLDLFRRTGFTLLSNVQQREFPRELFQVRMYALRPRAA